MFEKLQRAFWKSLTPDLVPDQAKPAAPSATGPQLSAQVLAALGGADNLKTRQHVALTRVRVELHDSARIDVPALRLAGVPGVQTLEGGVVHLITGL